MNTKDKSPVCEMNTGNEHEGVWFTKIVIHIVTCHFKPSDIEHVYGEDTDVKQYRVIQSSAPHPAPRSKVFMKIDQCILKFNLE